MADVDAEVIVLGAGVAPDLLVPPSPELDQVVARRLELPERFVLAVATLEPRKGLDVLIRAVARLSDDGTRLVVVGPRGWGDVDVATVAAAAGVGPRVCVLGRVADRDLGVVLRRAAVLVMPSRAEGFGLPVAEAMAVGTPVVCTDVPALVEVAGSAAEIVPVDDDAAMADVIGALLGDTTRRAELATRGRARAGQFDWDLVAARAWRLYRALLAKSGRAGPDGDVT